MKKKIRLLLVVICILSVCVFAGLIAIALDIRSNAESNKNQKTYVTPLPTPIQSNTESENKNEAKADNEKEQNQPMQEEPTVSATPTTAVEPVVLAFAGDVNLDEASAPVKKYDTENKDISKCLSEDLLEEMINADIMMLNNEFVYSRRGKKEENKSYTFRADPDRVEILKKMGVDIVSLANNHALDYGQDALLDTFSTLEEAAIDYVGAGKNIDRAKAPIYYEAGGRKIAFVAASRVIFAGSWYATEDRPGMVGTYDPSFFLESIKEARANSDYVIVYVHWGRERINYPEKYQRTLAQAYIDAGADAVIGCHPHVMQGFEFYKGKLIAYSLSNFWFSRATVESALLKLHIDTDGNITCQLLPVMSKNCYTYLINDKKEKDEYFDFIRKISFDVEIDDDGIITPAKSEK